uniref:Uncharacterized protein n=1 Tax=Rhizophora mucronata TaxID=61149 RepID=A0A2P2NQR5_RHIMU
MNETLYKQQLSREKKSAFGIMKHDQQNTIFDLYGPSNHKMNPLLICFCVI